VQVDPIKPTLKPTGTKRLKLKHNQLLSNFAFKFNMRRYDEAGRPGRRAGGVSGRHQGSAEQVETCVERAWFQRSKTKI